MKQILIIDDEISIQEVLGEILRDEQYRVITAGDGVEGLELIKKNPVDLVFLDVWLPKMGGIEVLEKIRESHPEIEVVIISGHANVDMAVKAIKMGAYDFVEKPLDIEKVLNLARRALERKTLRSQNQQLRRLLEEDQMVGQSSHIQDIRHLVNKSAPSDSRVMILGDNGTGKELIARMIHNRSERAAGPFIEVNCAAIPENLIESELFGHEKGAFTGAVSRRKGKMELADGGTLFLDEVADMTLSAQAKVLRAMQEMRFERVGGEESIKVDIRIISATNKNIREEIEENRFREDLYFRLNVIPIIVPPLAERPEDIPLLLNHFLEQFVPAEERSFTKEAVDWLSQYSWPGNIRELKNFAERVSVMTQEEVMSLETCKTFLGDFNLQSISPIDEEYGKFKLMDARDLFEKRLIVAKLEENGYNISKTAEVLGVYPSNLHNKIKKFGISTEK
ncbi:MAG: sigma-54 dependent transcriptional regulator [Spirochaetaceae bacterium]|jgi:two-component system nitrogen regulation response regulator NtrX|nr:sigma-54 dependent transcriptional regulator [Spirochaetaceae bacterium]